MLCFAVYTIVASIREHGSFKILKCEQRGRMNEKVSAGDTNNICFKCEIMQLFD